MNAAQRRKHKRWANRLWRSMCRKLVPALESAADGVDDGRISGDELRMVAEWFRTMPGAK